MALGVTAVPSSEALTVLLQQPTIAADQQIICGLLQVCKAWRAVIRSNGAPTDISFSADSKRLSDAKYVGGWLSKHPGCIRTLSFSKATSPGLFDAELEATNEIVRKYLEEDLQLAASPEGGGAQWRLQSYQSDLGVTPAMLAALPAATLTRLDISSSAVPDSLAKPLKLLKNLVDLAICPEWFVPAPVVAAISALRQLTKLSLDTDDPRNLRQLPDQLQQVALRCGDGGVVNISHLTNLNNLQLTTNSAIGPGSLLPVQLQQLTIDGGNDGGPVHVLGLTTLHRLWCLTIKSPITDASQLASLAGMSQLHELHLHQQYGTVSLDCARMWSRLPMLHSLGVYDQSNHEDDCVDVCQLAASAHSMTSLCLEFELLTTMDDHEVRAGLHLCEHLKGLAQLKELELLVTDYLQLGFGCLAELDVLHLTALTGLTRLKIMTDNGLTDTDVCALAIALRHLQHLSLNGGRLSTAPMPCFGLLTDLQHLQLRNYSSQIVYNGLRFLTSLNRLTHLELGALVVTTSTVEVPDVIDLIHSLQ